jgi:hypothetical protein
MSLLPVDLCRVADGDRDRAFRMNPDGQATISIRSPR